MLRASACILLSLAWCAKSQSPCASGEPKCTDGSEPDGSTRPPSCPDGVTPKCPDGSEPAPPSGGGPGGGGGGPGGGGGGGGGGGDDCSTVGGAYAKLDLSFSESTGKFSGSIVTNQCPSLEALGTRSRSPTSDCQQQVIPDPGFTYPGPMPLLGRAGLSLKGVNIYSPYEAGFGTSTGTRPPFPCQDLDQDEDQDGYCESGLDVKTCEDGLHFVCGADAVITAWFLDVCGGHATPYHLHSQPACEYDMSAPGHSPLIGIALDGYGMYGLYEDTDQFPVLDACNGHTGGVPTNSEPSVVASTVYHYHFTLHQPFTLGCYGPVDSLEECKSMYSTCNDGFVNVPASKEGGNFAYDLFCPCFTHDGSPYEGFEAAMNALGMNATHYAVQGVNDGTVASRQKPSSSSGGHMGMETRPAGASSSTECPVVSTSTTSTVGPAFVSSTTTSPGHAPVVDEPVTSAPAVDEPALASVAWSINVRSAWALGITIAVALTI